MDELELSMNDVQLENELSEAHCSLEFQEDELESQWEDDTLLDLSCVKSEEFLPVTTLKQPPICISTISNEFTSAYMPAVVPNEKGEGTDEVKIESRSPRSVITPESTSEELSQACSSIDLEWEDDSEVKLQKENKVVSSPSRQVENWRTVVVGGKNYKLDMNAIQPYRQILSHGGYEGDGLNAIVIFSACYLPSTKMPNSRYIMDNLFLYIVSTLDLLVAHEYLIVFFSSGCTQENRPPYSWLKKCYRLIDKRLRKSLKKLIIVHPSWHIRLIINFFKPFLSSKFSKKLKFADTLHTLADIVPVDEIVIPEAVQKHDLKLVDKKCNKKHS